MRDPKKRARRRASWGLTTGGRLDFEVMVPQRWTRQHTVTVALAIAVVLIWALVVYKVFREGDDFYRS